MVRRKDVITAVASSSSSRRIPDTIHTSSSRMEMSNNKAVTNADRSFTYQMFVHLEELRRAKSRILRLSYSKMELTSKLINGKLHKLEEFGSEDLRAINREIDFKEELRSQIMEMHEKAARHRQRARKM